MSWIIDKDYFPEGPPGTNLNAVGVKGPGTYDGDGTELKVKFRMYDDDDVLYYEGRMSREDFDPLEDFGLPNAGCTRIDCYSKRLKRWETI